VDRAGGDAGYVGGEEGQKQLEPDHHRQHREHNRTSRGRRAGHCMEHSGNASEYQAEYQQRDASDEAEGKRKQFIVGVSEKE